MFNSQCDCAKGVSEPSTTQTDSGGTGPMSPLSIVLLSKQTALIYQHLLAAEVPLVVTVFPLGSGLNLGVTSVSVHVCVCV